ncbi:MAG: peptidogalycan biosysnthesis protein [Geminicoccaceae bacterium]
MHRGYEPVLTYSAHHIPHPGFHAAVARFLEQERQEMAEQLTELRDLLPYRAPDGGIG